MDINRQTEVDTPGQGGKGQQRPVKTGVPGRRSNPNREGASLERGKKSYRKHPETTRVMSSEKAEF